MQYKTLHPCPCSPYRSRRIIAPSAVAADELLHESRDLSESLTVLKYFILCLLYVPDVGRPFVAWSALRYDFVAGYALEIVHHI